MASPSHRREIKCISGKNRKDGLGSPFHSLCAPSFPSVSHTHTQREAAEASCWARLILAGELWANPVRWLSQSTDKQRENLVMHQWLTMSQVAGTANGAGYSRPTRTRAEFTRSYITWHHAAGSYNGLACSIIAWAIRSCYYKLKSCHVYYWV